MGVGMSVGADVNVTGTVDVGVAEGVAFGSPQATRKISKPYPAVNSQLRRMAAIITRLHRSGKPFGL
jgi:hypothetical protein